MRNWSLRAGVRKRIPVPALAAVTAALLGACAAPALGVTGSEPVLAGEVAPPRLGADTVRHRVVGYFASWSPVAKGVRPTDLDGERLTEVVYAFANLADDGSVVLGDPCVDAGWCDDASRAAGELGGNLADLARFKARHRHVRTLIAIGGWTWSERFSDAALTAESRRRFARSAVDLFIRRWPGLFDGIDVDWEYPVGGGRAENVTRPEDRGNYTLLLGELRRQLDEQGRRDGRRYLLTIAAPAGPGALRHFELERQHPLLDWFNVMTYDYHAGSPVAHFNAPLRAAAGDPNPALNVESTVEAYLARGVPREKIMLGVPFYGYGFGGVPAGNRGLFQPVGGAEEGTWGVGGVDYRRLTARNLEAEGFQRHRSAEAGVPWLYNPGTGVWISYDDPASMALKGRFARERGLGGVMIWELGGDDGTLLPALHRALRGR
jgi:chitinase